MGSKTIIVFVSFMLGMTLGYMLGTRASDPDVEISSSTSQGNESSEERLASRGSESKRNFFGTRPASSDNDDEDDQSGGPEVELTADDYISTLSKLMEMERYDDRVTRMTAVLENWTKSEPEQVMAWLGAQPPSDEIQDYYYRVMQAYMDQNFEAAGLALAAMPAGRSKMSLVGDYVYELASTAPMQAAGWVSNLYDEEIRDHAMQQLLYTWVDNDANSALNYVMSTPGINPSLQGQIAEQASANLNQDELVMLRDSLGQYPSNLRPHLVSGIISKWIEDDPRAAKHWVESLDQSPARDKAVQSFVDYAGSENHYEAFQLAELVSSESMRVAIMSQVVEQWYSENPDAAKRALDSTDRLSEAQKTLLLGEAKMY